MNSLMGGWIVTIMLLAPLLWAWGQQAVPEFVEFTPPESDEVLFNPGMGLYLQYPPMDARPEEWFMRLCDIAYYRLDWADVNPQEDVYTFEEYFAPKFDFWVRQHGKRVAFRVMCQNMHSRGQPTPLWVFARGVPSVTHIALDGHEQKNPVFWDERYLDIHCAFIRKLGEYLDGRPGLEFVDIGSIGEWGEMHLARWTPQQLAETGYSEAKYIAAYRRVIDEFVRAFPRTRLFLNAGGKNHLTINDYAARRGVHFRQDGLTPTGASYDVGEWLYKPYAQRGVICNFEFHSSYEEMQRKGWDVRTTIEKGLSAPISYLNTNLFGGAGYRRAPVEVQEMLREAGRRIGFRFALKSLRYPAQLRLYEKQFSRLPLMATWRNEGVAPCYESYALMWTIVGPNNKPVLEQLYFPPTPTTLWAPGEEQKTAVLLRLPPGLPPGPYLVKVAMLNPEQGQTIRLPLREREPNGFYPLVKLPGVAATPAQTKIYESGFESEEELTSWRATEDISLARSPEKPHTGQSCLLLTGQAEKAWNYAQCRLPIPAVPYGLYRLSAWMLVEQIDNPRKPPYLKLAANDATGRWLTNFGTNQYNVNQLGAWQYLEALAELPAEAATLDIAVEKGDNTTRVNIRLRLDDIKVELLESP